MRLKTFHAKTVQAAMDLVRQQLGDDAIIVATHDEGARGARVTAAIETPPDRDLAIVPLAPTPDALERLTFLMERHGLGASLIDRIVAAAEEQETRAESTALEGALEAAFDFAPLPARPFDRPILIIGPPGTGKSTVAAKLAARAALAGAPTTLISADPVRLGAAEQLRLYAETLDAEFHGVRDAAGLAGALAQTRRDRLVVIDTPGINPYALDELAFLIELGQLHAMETVLVLGAARDAEEAGDIARAFSPARPTRLVSTGHDIARRLGGILAAADAGALALADYSPKPTLAEGLEPFGAATLAGLLSALVASRKEETR